MNRRTLAIATALVCVLALWCNRPCRAGEPAAAADTISGRVFLDANGNGRLDPGEPGLSGVAVTDGVSFASTGPDGSYSIRIGDDPVLPHRATHTVSVSWPAGKWPTGKWWARLDQVADPKNVAFGLRDDRQTRPFAFIQVTDNHGSPYGRLAKELDRIGPAVKFAVNTGDLFYVNYSHPPEANKTYQNYLKTLDVLRLPLFHAPGNHDLGGTNLDGADRTHPDYCNGIYTKYLGPVRWSFDYGGAHFVGIDWRFMKAGGHTDSGVPQSACDWLDKDLGRLPAGTPIVGFVHFPSSFANFWEVAGKHKATRILGGHGHRYQRLESHGVVATTTLNLSGAAGTIGVVGESGVEFVDYCPGCKAGGHHGKYCALASAALVDLQRGRGTNYPLGDKSVTGGAEAVEDIAAKGVSVSVKLDPGAGKAGLRIGERQPVEVACTAKGLVVNGLELPLAAPGPAQLEVFADGKILTVYALPGLRTIQARKVDRPGKVAVFADGGTASFRSLSVWELKGTAMPSAGIR